MGKSSLTPAKKEKRKKKKFKYPRVIVKYLGSL